MNREQAEKKARERLGGKKASGVIRKEGFDVNIPTIKDDGYNEAIDKAIPIVADLLMREAELVEAVTKEQRKYTTYREMVRHGIRFGNK